MPDDRPPARAALIVTTSDYADERFSRLRSPGNDADRLAQLLRDPDLGGFAVEIVRNAGVLTVKRTIERFLGSRRRDDLAVLYFSGHGVLDRRNRYFIAAADTEMDALASTGVDRDFLNARLEDCRAKRVLLLLDTCHSGAFTRSSGFKGGDTPTVAAGFEGSGRVVITASGPLEFAYEGETSSDDPSVFTAALVRGLETGEADRDKDDEISVDELFNYLCDEVRGQKPQFSGGGMSGRIVLAKVPPHRRQPAPLPSDLAEALESDSNLTKLGAVHRLVELTGSPDPSVVASARLGLESLADDDSRKVSTTALEALRSLAAPDPADDVAVDPTASPVDEEGPPKAPPHPGPGAHATSPAPANVTRTLSADGGRNPTCVHQEALGGHVNAVAFSPSGDAIAAATSKPRLVVRRTSDNLSLLDRSGLMDVTDCAWTRDGGSLAAAMGGKVRFFTSGDTMSESAGVLSHGWTVVHGVALAPDGRSAATAANDGLRWWSLETHTAQPHLDAGQTYYAVAIDPARPPVVAAASAAGHVRLYVMPTAELLNEFPHGAAVRSVAFSSDGRLLCSGSADGSVRVWDTESYDLVAAVDTGFGVRSVAVDSRARFVVSGGDSGSATLWPLDRDVPPALCPHPNWVYSVALDHSGRWLATGCRDKQVRVFDLTT